ncbi:LD-carboxypeptidase [soil metagenome]
MIIKPKKLEKNDTVAIVSTARKFNSEDLNKAINIFEDWGLNVKLGQNLYKWHHQFSGTDQERLMDIQEMINDPQVKAIFCARGGYGSTRIIDDIDFFKLFESPKWISGFSDVTALICQLHNLEIESIHGIMPLLFNQEGAEESIESLRKILFGEDIKLLVPNHPFNKPGHGSGLVIGGNLSILVNMIGTGSDVDTRGKILFLEDLDEYLYHIDRMMIHMKRAGKLHLLAGLIVGQFSDMKDNETPFGASAYEIIKEHTEKYNYPVCYNFPLGHDTRNLALPCTRKAFLEVTEHQVILEYDR